jgi:hypothetical protein
MQKKTDKKQKCKNWEGKGTLKKGDKVVRCQRCGGTGIKRWPESTTRTPRVLLAGRNSLQQTKRSDEVFLDRLAGVLFALEPARHAATTRPGFVRLRITVLGFTLPLRAFRTAPLPPPFAFPAGRPRFLGTA